MMQHYAKWLSGDASFRPLINTPLRARYKCGRGGSASQLSLMSQSLILSSDSLETDTDSSNSVPSANKSISTSSLP
jgi:hypothetical protein